MEASAKIGPQISLATCIFTICSSTMLIVNKVAITAYPAPNSLLLLQLLSSSTTIYLASKLGLVSIQHVSWSTVKSYVVVALAFFLTLFSNVKVLQYANVETFIVFRASTPLAVAVLDYVFLGRELPTRRSSISLFCLLLGAVSYVRADSHFEVRAYFWVFCWFVLFCFDQIFIKHVVDSTETSSWTNSFWTNTLATIPAFLLVLIRAEHNVKLSGIATYFVTASCLVGVAMSLSSFHLRGLVSATYFTIVGTVCKILSVIINYFIWDKHASITGLASLGFCIFSAVFYQQSPLRPPENHKYTK